MRFNVGRGWNIAPFNVQILASFSGLKLFKCVNWNEDLTHGGDISVNEVDTLFDYISDQQNQNGYTDYRKCHIKNTAANSTGQCYVRPALLMPDALIGRLDLTLAVGTDFDDMSNKPADESFGASIPASINSGSYLPVWIKRTITPGGVNPGYYTGIQVALTISEV